MRAPPTKMLVAPLMALALALAACGDPAGEDEAEGDAEVADDGEEVADDGEEAVGDGEDLAAEPDLCTDDAASVEAPDGFTVGLVTDIGTVTDGTFNEYAFEGLQVAADCFGFETEVIETSSEADYQNNMDAMVAIGPDAIVTVGFLLADVTMQFAEANPDIAFIGVDQFFEEYPDNYVGMQFREDQAGYLAGAMAGLVTESNVLGVVAGQDVVPPVVRLANGFEAGATAVNPEVSVQVVYHESFTDPASGRSTATQMVGEGADVIFGAGGETGSGGISGAAEEGSWVIGVDQDEWFTTFGDGSATGADLLLTSAIKRIDVGVFTQVQAVLTDEFVGETFTLSIENEGIGLAPAHEAEVDPAIIEEVAEIQASLGDGSLDTGVDPVTGQPLE